MTQAFRVYQGIQDCQATRSFYNQNNNNYNNRNNNNNNNCNNNNNQQQQQPQQQQFRFGQQHNNYQQSMPTPMDIGTAQRHGMTDEDREERLRKGLCFYCREHGHLANNCPKKW